MTTCSTPDKNDRDHRPGPCGFPVTPVVLAVAICAALTCAAPLHAQPTKEFVRSLITSKQPKEQARDSIRREFAGQPTQLIAIIEGLDEEDGLAFDVARLCQDGLGDLLKGEHYALLVSRISTAPSSRSRGVLAGVLPRSSVLIGAVKDDPDPLLQLLTDETESLNAIKALAEVLSRAHMPTALPVIRSKLKLGHINFGARISLEASLIRLGDQAALRKYAELLKSQTFIDQDRAVRVFGLSESASVMKYLIPWLDIRAFPEMNGKVDPPYRYADVAVRFARFFRDHESGPLRLGGIAARQYSDAEIEEIRTWWKTVKNTDEYR